MAENKKITIRVLVLLGMVTLFYLIVAFRLWHEQVWSASEYDSAIEEQTVRRIRQPAVRGRIFTSDGEVLADNVPVYNIVFDLAQMRQPGRASKTIRHIVDSAEKLAIAMGRDNPLKYDISFVFYRMDGGDSQYILKTAYEFAKELGRKSPLNQKVIKKFLSRQPKSAYTVFEDLSLEEYEKIRHKAKETRGVLLTDNKIQTHITMTPALPMTVFEKLTEEELAKVAEVSPAVLGMDIITIPVRRYEHGQTACHIIGYIRKDDPKTAEDRSEYFYYIPDKKGKKGLEKVYDESITDGDVTIRGLRGSPGNSLVLVDFKGYVNKTIGNSIEAQLGHDIVLTLDFKAQQIAEKLLLGKNGAFVLLDAGTGAVISMVSSPGYDISQFTPRLSPKYYNQLLKDPNRPLFNRALDGTYEPGSIIKPIMALSFLDNKISEVDTVLCEGRSYIGNASIRCASWRRGGHGHLDIVSALEQSCNVYFIEQGRILGLEKLAETLDNVGIGEDTEFEISNAKGLLASRAGKFKRTGVHWNAFDTGLLTIGQGEITVTPLQAALFISAIANGGTLWRPYLLKNVRDAKGNTILINKPFARGELNIPKDTLDIIHEGMSRVVRGRNGSGKQAATDAIKLYGKTGTAQKGRTGSNDQNTWFAGFGTHKEKTYAFAVFVEDGASGGKTCAPIAKAFFETWLKSKKNPN